MLRHACGGRQAKTTVYGMVYHYGLPYGLRYMVYYRNNDEYLRLKRGWGAPFSSLTILLVLEFIEVAILYAFYGCIIFFLNLINRHYLSQI